MQSAWCQNRKSIDLVCSDKIRHAVKRLYLVFGGKRIAQLFYAAFLRYGKGVRLDLVMLNGEWALLRFIDGKLESAQTFDIEDERIVRIQVQRNPDKLERIAARYGNA